MNESHGIRSYRAGCRCDVCRAANAGRVRRNRARRAADAARLSHGKRSAYDAGCRCAHCRELRHEIYVQTIGGEFPRANWWRSYVTELYWEQRLAREAVRENYRPVGFSVAGTSGAVVGPAQLEDEEFEKAWPTVTFKDVLTGSAGGRRWGGIEE